MFLGYKINIAYVFYGEIGTLRNHDGHDNGNVKTTTTTTTTFFCRFLCRPCTTTTWNDQILSLLGNGNGKAINSTIPVWTRARSLLFSSLPKSLLLSKWAPWDNRKQKVKGCEVYFSATFSWTSPLSGRKVHNIEDCARLRGDVLSPSRAFYNS